MIEHLTLDTFKEKVFDFETNKDEWKYIGSLHCIIDFSAEAWCIPCRTMAPILEELSETYKDKINIYKVDVDEEQELSMLFNIRSVPSILFIPMDGQPEMAMGALPKDTIIKAIDDILLKNAS